MKIFKGQGTADLGKPWRFEEDGLTVTRGCAWSPPGCHPTGCGIKTYVNAAGELVKIEGDENHPITNGRLCVRCLTIRDYVYNPDRVRYPMKRAREDRGKNKWERITWDEAFDTHCREGAPTTRRTTGPNPSSSWAARAARAAAMLPAYAQACIGNAERLLHASPATRATSRASPAPRTCWAPRYPEMDYAGGLPGRYDDPTFELPELIVFWAQGAHCRPNGDGLFGHAAIDMMRRGSKLMCVEPRVNWVSTRADWHLRLRPGTDTALGMAMLNVIIERGPLRPRLRRATGATASSSSPSVSRRCQPRRPPRSPVWMPASSPRPPASTPRPSPRRSRGAWPSTMKSNGVQAGHCILALEAITGNHRRSRRPARR